MENKRVAVLGATSLVGEVLLPALVEQGFDVLAYSRSFVDDELRSPSKVCWLKLGDNSVSSALAADYVICLAPIWVLPQYFSLFESMHVKRVLALSSTSCFTKIDSVDDAEQQVVKRLVEGERALESWASQHNVEWTVLRPTLVYGGGRDQNITAMAQVIQRFRIFPVLGAGVGLRQPVHRQDVAAACVSAMCCVPAANKAYNISGAEVLSYRQMVSRVFLAMGRRPLIVSIPLFVFSGLVAVARCFPTFRGLSLGMAQRMRKNMTFDHQEAKRDFAFSPRSFHLGDDDLPS